jgi:NAD(P)-dependent dehydrogenase (short-subunit alcohol dehydrogenase family)
MPVEYFQALPLSAMRRLVGRTAVITGAARGIGAGIARRFAAEGANLILVDRLDDELRQTAASLQEFAVQVEMISGDICAVDMQAQIAARAAQRFGHADILVNNAGIGVTGTIEDFSVEEWQRVIAVNLTAGFQLARALVPLMAAARHGRVINISSMNGLIGMRTDSAYAVTKAGLHALTRSIAVDYGRHGVTANAIAPGPIATPLNAEILSREDTWFTRTVVANKPIAGLGHVDDIAAAAAFFASDEGRFISGQVLAVDGGRYVADE